MGTIVVSENVTLDGVIQDPTGDEGFARGGWFARVSEQDREAFAKSKFDEALGAAALLLGRRSDEWFATRWSNRSGDWADRLNGLPKYVVSSTSAGPRWMNSELLGGDVVAGVSRLKRELDGEIVVYASRQLVQTLMEHHLVDELRLLVFPLVLGAGERLFGETGAEQSLCLLDSRTIGDSLTLSRYELDGPDPRDQPDLG